MTPFPMPPNKRASVNIGTKIIPLYQCRTESGLRVRGRKTYTLIRPVHSNIISISEFSTYHMICWFDTPLVDPQSHFDWIVVGIIVDSKDIRFTDYDE